MRCIYPLTLVLLIVSLGCEPKATGPVAKDQSPAPAPPPPSEFDPKNPADQFQTVNWLRSVWKEYDDVKADGNPVQRADALQKLSDKLEQLRGVKIRWPFRITAMGNDGQKDFLDISANDSLPTEFKFKTAKMTEPAAIARFYSGDDLTSEQYKTLKKNSPVMLGATLEGDFIQHRIVLDNLTIVDTK